MTKKYKSELIYTISFEAENDNLQKDTIVSIFEDCKKCIFQKSNIHVQDYNLRGEIKPKKIIVDRLKSVVGKNE